MTVVLLLLVFTSAAVFGGTESEKPHPASETFSTEVVSASPASIDTLIPDDSHGGVANLESPGIVVDESVMPSPDSRYWIVSSWKSPQQFEGRPRSFRPEVTCYQNGSGFRHQSLQDLKNALTPGVPICIVVHGSFMDHPSVRPESLSTWKWLKSVGKPVHFIYFSWPSDRPLTLAQVDIAILGNRASYNGFYLASLIKELPAECPVSLVGHSHGTRVISSALQLMSGGRVDDISHPGARCSGRRIRTVFVASAIDHDWLNPDEYFGRALMCTESLINVKNHKDPALFIYPFRRIGSSRALGCTGFTKSDRSDLGGWSRKVQDLDVTDMIGVNHMWPSYIEKPQLAQRLRNYLFFADQPSPIVGEPTHVVPPVPHKG